MAGAVGYRATVRSRTSSRVRAGAAGRDRYTARAAVGAATARGAVMMVKKSPPAEPAQNVTRGVHRPASRCGKDLHRPDSNERTAAHLRRYLPVLEVLPWREGDPSGLTYQVGERRYRLERGRAEYVFVARVCRPHRPHLFVGCR